MNDRCFALCLGDSLSDCDVMKDIPHIKECIYIGFLVKSADFLPSYLERFDVVIVEKNANMEFILDFLRFLLDLPDQIEDDTPFYQKWLKVAHQITK